MRELLIEAFLDAFDLDKGSPPATILRLAKEPGRSIRAVISGQRQQLYPAFKFLILAGALIILFSFRYHFFSGAYSRFESNNTHVAIRSLSLADNSLGFFEHFFLFAEDNATLLNIAAIPVFALFSWWWLSGRKYNFAENLVLNTFITAQQLIFILLFVPLYELFAGHRYSLTTVYICMVAIYNMWVYIQFFELKCWHVAKSAAVVIAGYLCQFPLNLLIFYIYERYVSGYLLLSPLPG